MQGRGLGTCYNFGTLAKVFRERPIKCGELLSFLRHVQQLPAWR
jgi:hypothetical protein